MFEKYTRHVEFLGEEIQDVHQVGLFGSQVLHLAAFRGVLSDVLQFLSAGADVNSIGDLGLTPLHYAVLGERADIVEFLISKGANVNLENEFSETPMQMAKIMGSLKIQELFNREMGVDIYSDGSGRQRWLDFRKVQELNFPDNWPNDN